MAKAQLLLGKNGENTVEIHIIDLGNYRGCYCGSEIGIRIEVRGFRCQLKAVHLRHQIVERYSCVRVLPYDRMVDSGGKVRIGGGMRQELKNRWRIHNTGKRKDFLHAFIGRELPVSHGACRYRTGKSLCNIPNFIKAVRHGDPRPIMPVSIDIRPVRSDHGYGNLRFRLVAGINTELILGAHRNRNPCKDGYADAGCQNRKGDQCKDKGSFLFHENTSSEVILPYSSPFGKLCLTSRPGSDKLTW